MRLSWKEFHIDLSDFFEFVKINIQSSDGIVADEFGFNIIEKIPFTQEEIDLILNYYNELQEI